MRDTKALLAAYAPRIEAVIRSSGSPQQMQQTMDEIAYVAQRRGLIDNSNSPRRSSAEEFVMDLWTENPVIRDRLNLSRASLPQPSAVTTLTDILDVLQ